MATRDVWHSSGNLINTLFDDYIRIHKQKLPNYPWNDTMLKRFQLLNQGYSYFPENSLDVLPQVGTSRPDTKYRFKQNIIESLGFSYVEFHKRAKLFLFKAKLFLFSDYKAGIYSAPIYLVPKYSKTDKNAYHHKL